MPETAKRTARVPILGENGRISDDYIPAAIGENVTKAESAATRAETAATAAEGSASAASTSATQASGSASAASASASQAQQSAATAGGAATSAQSAQTAAEAAQSAAAGSAQDAQQSATAAQQSAASVADKFITSAQATTLEPGSQATASVENQVLTIGVPKGDKGDKGEKGDTGTGVPEGGEPGQLLSKTDSGTAWVDPPSGNVLTSTLGPAPVLSADDAYATKPRRLTVYGNTRQNLWVNPSGTSHGVTATSNSDGSVTLSGTAQSNNIWIGYNQRYILRPGSTYTLTVDKAPQEDVNFCVKSRDAENVFTLIGLVFSGRLSHTFTVPDDCVCCNFLLSIEEADIALSGTYRVMLNEGSEAQPWCPPGLNSVGELSVVCAGKNLLARIGPSLPYTIAGITFSDNGDGGIRISGTAKVAAYYNFFSDISAKAPRITPGEYTASLIGGYSGLNLSVGYYDGVIGGSYTPWLGTNVPGVSNTGSIDRPVYLRPFLSVAKGKTVDTVVYPQLEFGSAATAYEPPHVTTTPVDLAGHSLNSLPDGTRDELRIDGTGAVTLVQRVGVAAAPTEASGWSWVSSSSRAGFMLPATIRNKGTWGQSTELLCDKLPPATSADDASYAVTVNDAGFAKNPAITSTATAATVAGGATYLYPLATPQTIPLTPVTLPTLPSPNITVYHDSDVPSDITLEYERDVNIVIDNLAKQIAGTAATVAINEATR